MKKNINISIIVVLLLTIMTNISCDTGLGMDNPNNTDDAPTSNILGLAELAAGSLNESDNSRYAGVNANYISGLAQQFAPINDYVYSPGDFDGLWTTIYQDGLKPAKLAENKGQEEGDLEMVGTAQLLQALFLMEAASNWGDVPYQEAVITGIIEPQYESQVSVLNATIQILDKAIDNAGSSTKYFNDGIGGTETTSTIAQIANTLKARAYLTLKMYPEALAAAQSGIQEDGDLILTHSNQIGAKNMYYQFLVEQRGGYIGPTGSYLEKLLNPADASANRILVTPGDTNRYNFYYSSTSTFNTNAGGVFADDASISIVSYFENKLIEAEAAYRSSQEGIALNALNTVRDALAAKYSGSFPHSSASGNTLLLQILEEKYISIFPSSQSFHDLSRTNNILGVEVKTGTELPKRFLYSQDEIDANSNVPDPRPDIFTQTPINN